MSDPINREALYRLARLPAGHPLFSRALDQSNAPTLEAALKLLPESKPKARARIQQKLNRLWAGIAA